MQSTSPATTEPLAETPPLTPDEFRVTVARVERNCRRYIDMRDFVEISVPIIVILIAVCTIWIGGGMPICCGTVLIVIFILTLYGFARLADTSQQEIATLIQFVTDTQDVNMLGSLLTIRTELAPAVNDSSPLAYAVNVAVKRLLPLVQASDTETLSIRHQERLCVYVMYASITFDNDADAGQALALSALKVLEQGGVKQILPDLEIVLKSDNTTNEVRIAARHCAQVIRERIAREEGRDVLLRPERKLEAIDTLLRLSEERQDTPSEQLLRANLSEPGDRGA